MEYLPRIVDRILDEYLQTIGAIVIEGAKWCGKTTTGLQFAKSVLKMQDPRQQKNNLLLAQNDPVLLLQGEVPRIIDEWQLAPELWDAVRYEVDERGKFGQFILTGSARPADYTKIHHSGTGRIAKLLMRPMSLFESGDSTGQVSLGSLFSGSSAVQGFKSSSLKRLAHLICRGGWPQSLSLPEKFVLIQPRQYYDSVVDGEVGDGDNVHR